MVPETVIERTYPHMWLYIVLCDRTHEGNMSFRSMVPHIHKENIMTYCRTKVECGVQTSSLWDDTDIHSISIWILKINCIKLCDVLSHYCQSSNYRNQYSQRRLHEYGVIS